MRVYGTSNGYLAGSLYFPRGPVISAALKKAVKARAPKAAKLKPKHFGRRSIQG